MIDYLTKSNRLSYISSEDIPFIGAYEFQTQEESDVDDEIKEKFEEVLNLLSARQKEALYLRFQLELSYEEVSRLLGINYQSARNLIHRAISKVRESMDLSMFVLFFIHFIK